MNNPILQEFVNDARSLEADFKAAKEWSENQPAESQTPEDKMWMGVFGTGVKLLKADARKAFYREPVRTKLQ
jgi:hypothetical protein